MKLLRAGISLLVLCLLGACSLGGDIETLRERVRQDHTHNWGAWTLTADPTCTTAGKETRVCSLNAAHIETRAVAVNPDAHNWGNWVQTKAPTETEDGEETRTCTLNTEHTETRAVAALNHTHQWGVWTLTTAPTCTTAGEETRVCSLNAAHIETRVVAVNPDAHNWGNWVQTKAPTETEDGEETRTCTLNAEHTETRAIAATANLQLSGTVSIFPNIDITTGTELTANYTGDEIVSFQWNKDGTAISGATSNKYTPTEAGSYTVTVSTAGYNSKTSAAVTVTVTVTAVTLDVEQIIDNAPIIANITISRANNGYPVTYTVTVDASDYDAGSINWEVAGVGTYAGQTVTGNSGSFTLDATEVKYNSLGIHALTLTVTKGGLQYQKAIPFTIVQ